ncbi:MAG: hypothetical protein QN189_08845 [Armatimonadota bacterium]|nr:hypothetical protein [Armatimonadota bacterium]
MGVPEYDVLIAGASFAGLAVVRSLVGGDGPCCRVLLVDRKPVGEGQTSACAAPVSLVRRMGAAGSILQEHPYLVLHTASGSQRWVLPEPFCTFDYRRFCLDSLHGLDVEVKVLRVHGREGTEVLTPHGRIKAQFLVDCTGWRAALAGPGRPARVPRTRWWMAFGLETEIRYELPPGLHFYFVPEVPKGYAWAFPCGGTVRFGVLRYLGGGPVYPSHLLREGRLLRTLERFLKRFGLRPSSQVHGGFLGGGLRPPLQDRIFFVGDSAGHCLPLSGEGIRTAVQAGWLCGTLLRKILEGQLELEDAQRVYSGFVAQQRWRYRILQWFERVVILLSPGSLDFVVRIACRMGFDHVFLSHYFALFQGPDSKDSV